MTTDQKIALIAALSPRAAYDETVYELTQQVLRENSFTDIPLETALQVVCQHIKNAPDYRESWVANIAVAFQQALGNYEAVSIEMAYRGGRRHEDVFADLVHGASNKAANNFIDLLIRDLTEPDNDDIKN